MGTRKKMHVGDLLTFKAATRCDYKKATRKITGFDHLGRPLARKPSAHNLAWSRSWEKYQNSDASSWLNAAERRARKAKEARDIIGIYADRLEITENQAKARIAAQRQHVARLPLVDLSLEYDL